MAQLIIITSLFVFLLLIWTEGQNRLAFYSPVKLILLPWIGVFTLHALPLMTDGYYHLDVAPTLFIAANILLFVMPLYIVSKRPLYVNRPKIHHLHQRQNVNLKRLNKVFMILALLAISGTVFDTVGKFLVYGLDLTMDLTTQRRMIHSWGDMDVNRPLYMKIGLLTAKFWGPTLIISILMVERLSSMNKKLAVINFLCPIVLSITYLGRGAMVLVFWIVITGMLLRKAFGLTAFPKLFIIRTYLKFGIAAIIFVVAYFFAVRTPFGHKIFVEQIQYGFVVKAGPQLSELLNLLPQSFMLIGLLTAYYFASPMYHFSFFWTYTASGPYLGFSRILPPLVVSQLSKVGLNPFGDVRTLLENQYAVYSLPFRVFRTNYATLIYEFGKIGTIVFTIGLGFYFARRYKMMRKLPSIANVMPVMLLTVYALHGILQSFLIMQDAFFIILYTWGAAWYIGKKCDVILPTRPVYSNGSAPEESKKQPLLPVQ